MSVAKKHEESERDSIDSDALEFLRFSFIAAYFVVWHRKNKIRDRIRLGSLAIISVSTALLFLKFLIEIMGGENILAVITSSTTIPVPHVPMFLIIGAVAYLLFHDIKESQKPAHEYKFVKQLSQFMLDRPQVDPAVDINAVIDSSLRAFHGLFKGKKFDRCSFYVLEPESLGTKPRYFFEEPDEGDPNYLLTLKKGEGVAGRVAEDGRARYVPRLFFPICRRRKWSPLLFFPHAVIFGVRRNSEDGSLELFSKGLDPFAFTPPKHGNPSFRSIVSVPVKSVTEEVYGVMNFDFRRYDPLNKSDIAMCVAFGLLLGDEIGRLKSLAKP